MGFFQSRLEIKKLKKEVKNSSTALDKFKVVDLKDSNLVPGSSYNFPGIYQSITRTRKVILLTNIKIVGQAMHDMSVIFALDAGNNLQAYFGTPVANYQITITNGDALSIEEV